MRYALIQLVLAHTPEVVIDKNRYDAIVRARSDLTDLTSIEEKFDIALENHYELEKELTAIAARDMMFSEVTEIMLWNLGNLLNRRVNNILSSGRAYLDHTAHHISNTYGDKSDMFQEYEAIRRKQYDKGYEFRIVEAMRNYGQHRGLPIHGWTLGRKKVGSLDDPDHEYSIGIKIKAKNLREDGKFKARALQDIDELGGTADLLAVIRGYIEALSEIHCDVRAATKARIEEIDSILLSAVEDYKQKLPPDETFPGIAVAVLDDSNCAVEYYYIVPEAIEFRKTFVKKNIPLVNFKKRHVSSKIENNKIRK